ncbi:unnamed protein product, partial [Gordionus sp. m RMFG-2023]
YDLDIDSTTSNVLSVSIAPFAYLWGPNIFNTTIDVQDAELEKLSNKQNILVKKNSDSMVLNVFLKDLLNKTYKISSVSSHIPLGLDIISYYIHKGRDHGTPGYMAWRRYCKIKPDNINDFEQLATIFGEERSVLLNALYSNVEDIDLLVGLLLEAHTQNDDFGTFGPTASCIMADQFMRLRRGDRFWYESNIEPNKFTSHQINEIKKIKLSRILCQTMDIHKNIQPDSFLVADANSNFPLPCEYLSSLNLSHWREISDFNNLQKYTDRKLDENKILFFTQIGANNAHIEAMIEMNAYQKSYL